MLKNMKKAISKLLVCSTVMSLVLTAQIPVGVSAATGDATVNLSNTKQSITGFGASSAWCGTVNDSVMNSLYKDLGYSILRLRVEEAIGDAWKSGNFSKWAPELANAKKASANGAVVFASPWNPPASMQENFSKSGDSSAQRLKYDKYSEYVQYLNAYVKYMKDNGVNLYAISVQNEPDYASDWNWWTPQEMLNFMKNYAGSINCKVMAPESFQYLKNMSDPILNDATALANMDILGFHLYGTPLSQFAYPLYQQKSAGKEVWMTEHYFDDDNTSTLMNMGKEIHDCMVTGNLNAYVYWWITWPNGLATSSGQIYKRAYVLGQFAKFIRPGYSRVDATANPKTGVYVSAYKGDGKVTIVAINQGTSAVSQNFVLQNGETSKVSTWVTDSSKNMAAGAAVNVSGGSFTAQLPAQSITTFVGDLGSVTPPAEKDAFSKLEAENYDDQSGVQNGSCDEGGEAAAYIENGDYAVYKNVNFGTGAASFKARVSSATNGGKIEIRLDSPTGTLAGTCDVAATGDWQTFADATCNISGVSGKHDVYLKFTGESGYLFNINWFTFNKESKPDPEKLGDLNSDGQINALDFVALKKHLLGTETLKNSKLADLDGNGTVDVLDFSLLKKYLLGTITAFPGQAV